MNRLVKSASVALILAAGIVATAANATPVSGGDHDDQGSGQRYSTPAVPEAGTLPLMVIGLGLVRLRLRRKNKSEGK